MKKHILGLIVATAVFAIAVYIAPVRFIEEGVGSGTAGAGSFCSFAVYSTSHMSRLSYWTCTFDDEQVAKAHFENIRSKQNLVAAGSHRLLVKYDNEFATYYCSTRLYEDLVSEVCSPSIHSISAFEEQTLINQ